MVLVEVGIDNALVVPEHKGGAEIFAVLVVALEFHILLVDQRSRIDPRWFPTA